MKQKTNMAPLISVCIPVFSTEQYLAQCLRSVYVQDFADFEVVVVSDDSKGKDEEGRPAKKIVKALQKECDRFRRQNKLSPVKIRYVEHQENRGCVEVRRTLVYESKGAYLAMLDSDDELIEGALSALYERVLSDDADIVHGTFVAKVNKCGAIFYGTKEGMDIIRSWLCGQLSGNICGKLILRELYLKAYEQIPYTECNMADDVLIFFFVAQFAKRYVGIENKVYRYRIDSGMSSCRKIDTIKKWKLICTAASVFTVISMWMKEKKTDFSETDVANIGKLGLVYIVNNLQQLHHSVVPELKEQAHAILCDYWGAEFVQNVETAMKKKGDI